MKKEQIDTGRKSAVSVTVWPKSVLRMSLSESQDEQSRHLRDKSA